MSNLLDMMLEFSDEDDDDNFLTGTSTHALRNTIAIPHNQSIPIESENINLDIDLPLSLSPSNLDSESTRALNNLDSTSGSTVSPIRDQDLNDSASNQSSIQVPISNVRVAIDNIDDTNDLPSLDPYQSDILNEHNVTAQIPILDQIQSESPIHQSPISTCTENQAHDQPIPVPIPIPIAIPIPISIPIPIPIEPILPIQPAPIATPIEPHTCELNVTVTNEFQLLPLKCQHTCIPLCPERKSNIIFHSKFNLSRHHTDANSHPHHREIKSAPRNIQRAIHTNKTVSSTECRKCLSIARKKNNSEMQKNKNSTTLNNENKTNTSE